MSLKVVDVGLQQLLEYLREKLNAVGNTSIRLYKNNHTPAAADLLGTYTEADFAGYSRVSTTWNAATLDTTAHKATMVAPVATYLCAGGGTTNNVYGYYVVDASENLLWAELFTGGPFSMANFGDIIAFQPVLTQISQF